ncbi:hypothetical protein [Maribellus mangrovi]|uniref:hypothetical protein n=1 Tax=Maribellus mangrovi TaxID=3133146 RepID=UPI0030EBED1F
MDKLKNDAPELSKIKKENPFRTPDNYFDDFSARLQMQIDAEKRAKVPGKIRFIQLLKPALGLAASFALIIMLVYVPLKTFMPHHAVTLAENTEEYDTETGILNYIENIDESSFISLLNETDDDDNFTDDDLALYVSANFNDYELYENLQNQ